MTKAHPNIKLENSPTPPVVENITLIRFFTRQTIAPESGPIANAAIRAGSYEKSILIKLGISGTLKLIIINTADNAPNKPVSVMVLTFMLLFFLFILISPAYV